MKKIREFIINKVKRPETDTIELFTKVDSESQYFVIKIDKSSGGLLKEF